MALKNFSANCFRKFKRLQLTFQVVFAYQCMGSCQPASVVARSWSVATVHSSENRSRRQQPMIRRQSVLMSKNVRERI